MTAVAASTRGAHRVGTLPVAWAIGRRSLVNIFRIPAAFVPILAMPLFFVIAFGGSFDRLTSIPGFPTTNILDWMVPFAILQGSAFAGFAAGFATVRDITTGFYDRLLLSPGSRAALLVGPVIASVARATISVTVVWIFGVALGADFPGGVAGLVVLWLAAAGISVLATGWALGLVFRIRDQQAAPLLQLGIFVSMFLSTGQVPLAAQTGWVRGIARVNPVSNILDLGRQGFLGHVTWAETWPGLLALAGTGAVLWAFAARGARYLVP